jgi:hypothetical protein
MHTITMLRRTLGLASDNQVRNRIEQIKDLLSEHIRRGPNNQIFLTDQGLDLMKQFQELYDSGLTLSEASHVMRANAYKKESNASSVSSGFSEDQMKPTASFATLTDNLSAELTRLREQVAVLAAAQPRAAASETAPDTERPWWNYLREDADVT